jgi:hypothetical protein
MTSEQLVGFWEVAQRRLRAEERGRLAGLFVAFVDALRWVVVPLWAGKNAPRPTEPWYLAPESAAPPKAKGLAQLVRDLPSVVEHGGERFDREAAG